MAKRKRLVTSSVRVDSYAVMTRAIEEGVAYGWRRAHKHTNTPGEEVIMRETETGVINAICEYFSFGEPWE